MKPKKEERKKRDSKLSDYGIDIKKLDENISQLKKRLKEQK